MPDCEKCSKHYMVSDKGVTKPFCTETQRIIFTEAVVECIYYDGPEEKFENRSNDNGENSNKI